MNPLGTNQTQFKRTVRYNQKVYILVVRNDRLVMTIMQKKRGLGHTPVALRSQLARAIADRFNYFLE